MIKIIIMLIQNKENQVFKWNLFKNDYIWKNINEYIKSRLISKLLY